MRAITLALFTSALVAMGIAAAQQQPQTPDIQQQDRNLRSAPDLRLSTEQKQTIYASISSQNVRSAAPPTFLASVGEVVPEAVKLQPLPKTIVELMPQTKDYEFAMVANQVLLVDPQSKKIVEVIGH